jgi:hypothetical protein
MRSAKAAAENVFFAATELSGSIFLEFGKAEQGNSRLKLRNSPF